MSQAWEDSTDRHVAELIRTGLDRYEIKQLLGKGGMGEVYLGVHRTIEKQVAIKTLAYEHRKEPSLNQRFLREAKAASKIRNEHIVDITDFGQTPLGCSYFVMEWLEGEDLAATIKREAPIPWARTRALLLQVLEALEAAHQLGVVHRDIKPANCFRTTRSNNPDFIKVLDFGIARAPEEQGEALTGTGMILGTAEYIAPEQGKAEPVDARTDIYAVGVMMFEMLAGRRPFHGRTAFELVSKHLTEYPPILSQVASQPLPPELDGIVACCLEKDPTRRFPSARALADALRAVPDQAGAAPSAVLRTEVAPTGPLSYPPSAYAMQGASGAPVSGSGGFKAWHAIVVLAMVIGVGAGVVLWSDATTNEPVPPKEDAVAIADPPPPDEPDPAPAGADEMNCPGDMMLLEGGGFFIGTSEDSKFLASAKPAHKVTLDPYCLDTYEVTLSEYRDCSRAGECQRASRNSDWPQGNLEENEWKRQKKVHSELCNERATGHGEHPVNCITYQQAESYCRYVGKRIPTEAEWEFAARGSDGRTFPWGDDPPTEAQANACGIECRAWRAKNELAPMGTMFETDDGYPGTSPVGRFEAGKTDRGLYDMVGNVFEWTSSDFRPYTAEGYGPAEGEKSGYKVIRGGAFNSPHPDFAKPAMRAPMAPSAHTHGIGVRCASAPAGDDDGDE